MYDNMNRQESALRQLFEGYTQIDTTLTQVDFVPEREGRTVLFRFSSHFGLVDADDLSGEPYELTIVDEHTATDPMADPAEKKKEDKADIGLRSCLPSKVKATLNTGNATVATYETTMAQFGFVQSLSGDLFGKKQSAQVVFDPMTGNVRSIKSVDLK